MRTASEIDITLAQAKLVYSYRFQQLEQMRMRGLSTLEYDERNKILIGASNVIWTLDRGILSLSQQSILCDYLIRWGFYHYDDELLFTEEIYTEDFDVV